MAILRGFPPSNTISPGPKFPPMGIGTVGTKRACPDDICDITNDIEYGYVKWRHCPCSACHNIRAQKGVGRCTGNCDGCKRMKDNVKLPWAVRLARGHKHGII